MADYEIVLPGNRSMIVSGDAPPTTEQVTDYLRSYGLPHPIEKEEAVDLPFGVRFKTPEGKERITGQSGRSVPFTPYEQRPAFRNLALAAPEGFRKEVVDSYLDSYMESLGAEPGFFRSLQENAKYAFFNYSTLGADIAQARAGQGYGFAESPEEKNLQRDEARLRTLRRVRYFRKTGKAQPFEGAGVGAELGRFAEKITGRMFATKDIMSMKDDELDAEIERMRQVVTGQSVERRAMKVKALMEEARREGAHDGLTSTWYEKIGSAGGVVIGALTDTVSLVPFGWATTPLRVAAGTAGLNLVISPYLQNSLVERDLQEQFDIRHTLADTALGFAGGYGLAKALTLLKPGPKAVVASADEIAAKRALERQEKHAAFDEILGVKEPMSAEAYAARKAQLHETFGAVEAPVPPARRQQIEEAMEIGQGMPAEWLTDLGQLQARLVRNQIGDLEHIPVVRKLTPEEQIQRLDSDGFVAKKERARLQQMIADADADVQEQTKNLVIQHYSPKNPRSPFNDSRGFIDIEPLERLVVYGANLVKQGFRDFSAWSSAMVEFFGKGVVEIGERLRDVFNTVIQFPGELLSAASAKLPPELISRLSKVPFRFGRHPAPEVAEYFTPQPKVKLANVTNVIEGAHTKLVARFTPLRVLEEKVRNEAGLVRAQVDMARKFEMVPGATGQADADLWVLRRQVKDKIRGFEDDFKAIVFLRREVDRLAHGEERRFGKMDIAEANARLNKVRLRIGNEKFAELDAIGRNEYQRVMDDALKLQVQSGRLSPERYDQIKAKNDYYAPYRVLRYIETLEGADPAAGKQIDTQAEYTKAITGTDETEVIVDIIDASQENIFRSRILAEKNLKMLELAGLADIDESGELVRKLKFTEDPRPGFAKVSYFEDGKLAYLEVGPDVAEAVKGLNQTSTGLMTQTLRLAQAPLKAGATGANAAFQVVNLAFADQPRLALLSRYGLRPEDVLPQNAARYMFDFLYAFYSSMRGNLFTPNEGYMRWLRSGAARSTIQSWLTPELLSRRARESNASIGDMLTHGPGSPVKGAKNVIKSIADFSNAIEETTKIMGLMRGERIEKLSTLSGEARQEAMDRIVSEVRNYSGSPDFSRKGGWGESLNLLFMFLNARIQGTTGDIARLAGRNGKKEALSAWTKMGSTVGVAATLLHMHNRRPENWADYNKVPPKERENYFMRPKYDADGRPQYFINEDGERVREYDRHPKREFVKLFANLIESSIDFGADSDPDAYRKFAVNMLENLSPVNIEGRNEMERMESVLSSMNPLIKAPFEAGMGRNTFYHKDIIPEHMRRRSPWLQYDDNTGDLFVRLAQAYGDDIPIGEPMDSPLRTSAEPNRTSPRLLSNFLGNPKRIEQFTQALTAGLITQFANMEPLEGRSPLSVHPVGKRFFRSTYVNRSELIDRQEQFLNTQANRAFERDATIDRAISDIRLLPPDSGRAVLSEIAASEPLIIDGMRRRVMEQASGKDAGDMRVSMMGVNDGTRAQYYVSEMMEQMDTQEERWVYIMEQAQKGLMTEDVLDQVIELMSKRAARAEATASEKEAD